MRVARPARTIRLVRAGLLVWIALNLIGTWSLLSRSDPYNNSDSAYYFQRGREIARGQWATESVIVSHLVRYPSVVHPSFDYWQPLAAVLSGGCGWLVGDPPTGARLAVFVFGSALLPGLVYLFVVAGGASPVAGLAAAALYVSIARIDDYRLIVDTVPFAGTFLIAGGLAGGLAVSRATRPPFGLCCSAGAAFACAAMTRGDGAAVGLALGVLISFLAPPRERARVLALFFSAFLVTCSPLVLKNLIQFGSPISPGAARVPWLTHYCDWNSFGPGALPTRPALGEWLAVRKSALGLAARGLLRSPLVLVCIASVGVGLVALRRSAAATRESPGTRTNLLLVSLASYAAFTGVGVLLAPAVTLWFHRSPLPYWPIALSGGVLAADHLARRYLRRAGWRYVAAGIALALVSPGVAFNPVRHLGAAPRRLDPRFAAAAERLPPAAVAVTNEPLPLYLHHAGGVVRLPDGEESAIAESIVHYAGDYLVLFPEARGCTSDRFLDRLLATGEPGPHGVAGRLTLLPIADTAEFRIYRVERP